MTFKMKVDNVFFIKSLNRVIVTGVVAQGSVKVGDDLVVKTASGDIPVRVEKLEHPRQILTAASKGQDVGLMLTGIGKEQVRDGDFVESSK